MRKIAPGEPRTVLHYGPSPRRGRQDGEGRKHLLWRGAALVACALLLISVPLSARRKQPPPRVVAGIVMDPQDNPLVGAVVEMTDVQTGKKQAMYTQAGGHYEFSGLNRNHDYHVQAKYNDQASRVRTASSFDTRDRIVLNLTIPAPKEE